MSLPEQIDMELLELAFAWTCPKCLRRHVVEPITGTLTEEQIHRHFKQHNIKPGEVDPRWYQSPCSVTCDGCGTVCEQPD